MINRRQALTQLAMGGVALAAPPPKAQISVAAASNLTVIAQQLGDAFEKASGIRPVFSFASTAQLARQIEDGAPFDVFAAADTTHVDELVGKGSLLKSTRAVYATGILALWFPKEGGTARRVEDLTNPEIRTISLARPELAPYGEAAMETLQKLNLWEKLKPRVVYASSVSMAKQYGTTGNADAVFVPKALVLKEKGAVVVVDEKLHKPIEQAVAVVSASKQKEAATRFATFLAKGEGHAILLANGYH